ncbi:MAG TPA: hypothetical protein VGO22_19635 [Pseudorhizobium sp.]|jgi:hypothetical protein|nr:hypothetical protein [Pseudorhizobium sp.]
MPDEEDRVNVTAQCMLHEPPVPVVVEDAENDGSKVTCPKCGKDYGSWGEVKAAMTEAATAQQQEKLTAPFQGLEGWKVTRD